MVSVCAGCNVFEPWASSIVAAVGALAYLFLSGMLIVLRIDDPVDAIPVHGAGGIVGIMAVPIFMKVQNSKGLIQKWQHFRVVSMRATRTQQWRCFEWTQWVQGGKLFDILGKISPTSWDFSHQGDCRVQLCCWNLGLRGSPLCWQAEKGQGQQLDPENQFLNLGKRLSKKTGSWDFNHLPKLGKRLSNKYTGNRADGQRLGNPRRGELSRGGLAPVGGFWFSYVDANVVFFPIFTSWLQLEVFSFPFKVRLLRISILIFSSWRFLVLFSKLTFLELQFWFATQ